MNAPDTGRKVVHHRQIDLRFFSRPDGLYEVEGALLDRKTHAFRRQLADEELPAGEPLHDIVVNLVVDEHLRIHQATARMQATPFDVCRRAETTLQPLIGLTMSGGWNRRVRELLGRKASCTHIVELLGPMATAAYQGLAPLRLARINDPVNETQRQAKVDSCLAYAAEGPVVALLWPHLHRPTQRPGA